MIGISKLYCGSAEASDALRYGRTGGKASDLPSVAAHKKPVVVWNCTRRCNLRCLHCYSTSTDRPALDELTHSESRAMIDDLAAFGIPVLLFSGGEPLLREDIFDLIAHAHEAGLRTVLSTNGTLIDVETAGRVAEAGLNYVGVSLDGLEPVNDEFRGQRGAFRAALTGIRNCLAAGVKVGLRLTMNGHNLDDMPGIFDLIEREGIPRVCFYHLVYTGRGRGLRDQTLTHAQTREALDLIMDRTAGMHAAGRKAEVLTVDNHADGPYVYMRLVREDGERAEECLRLLRMNGGNSSGVGIGCVSWNGDVLPDQFWRRCVLGNVRRRAFSEIWTDPGSGESGLLGKLRDRARYLRGRCERCRWLDVCNGNLRARAEAVSGGTWDDDPGCYLTDKEIR